MQRVKLWQYLSRAVVAICLVLVADRVLDAIAWMLPKPQMRVARPGPPIGFAAEAFAGATLQPPTEVNEPGGRDLEISIDRGLNRRAAHDAVATALAKLSFYDAGAGMYATPSVSYFYSAWGCDEGWKGKLIRQVARHNLGLYSTTNVATGFLARSEQNVPIVVTGCATCHFGRALGLDVPGLGSKTIDPGALGQWINNADGILSRLGVPQSCGDNDRQQFLQQHSLGMADRLCHAQINNQTQGMVPVALIFKWFYDQADVPMPSTLTPGAVKVPALWGYGEKIRGGIFCDGMGDGHNAAWAAAVELAGGNRPETVREKLPEILHAEQMFGELLPPAYPLAVDWRRAAKGKSLFAVNCQQCHGQYQRDDKGLPMYERPQHYPADEVGTDTDRLDIVTAEGQAMIGRSPLSDLIRIHPQYQKGYFAPRLEGIWCRFPYLHNGSVPNILELLTEPAERAAVFDLRDAGELNRFDQLRLGLDVPPDDSAAYRQLTDRAAGGARNVYDTSRLGHSNGGHNFGTQLSPNEKRDLVEYLKTL
jgi:hypothetical protein